MGVKIYLILLNFFYSLFCFSQVNKLEYCNCIDSQNLISENTLNFKRYCNNKLSETGSFKNGIPDDTFKIFDNNNVLIKQVQYKNGLLDGNFKLFNEKGKIKLDVSFRNGKKVNRWQYFNNNGQLKISDEYDEDKPIGTWQFYSDKGKELFNYDFNDSNSRNKELTDFYKSEESAYMAYSSEWYFSVFPTAMRKFNISILGGFEVLNYSINSYIEINNDFWDTYFNRLIKLNFSVTEENVTSFDYTELHKYTHNTSNKVIPFIISTNKKNKIKEVDISDFSKNLQLIKIIELVNILPPFLKIEENPEFLLLLDINKAINKK